ncbi:MAG TPA: hypothetical protein VGB85_27375, partial [Nannocystis sp.]
IVLVSACGGKSSTDTDTDTGSETTVAQTDPSGSSSGASTSGETPTSGATESDDTGTGEATTGAPDEGMACAGYCEYQVNCWMEDLAVCLDTCEAELAGSAYIGPDCVAEQLEYYQCYGELTCADGEEGEKACAGQGDGPAPPSTACILPACETQCAKDAECGGDPAVEECAQSCSYFIGLFVAEGGEDCGKAYEALGTCTGSLTCEQYANQTGCEAEIAAIETSCE